MQIPDWEKAGPELVKEALRQGELRLSAQVTLATSADQRATVLAGIYVAAATGVIAALATAPDAIKSPILIAGAGAAASCFLAGAIFCIFATLPTTFWTPGNDPEAWWDDIIQNKKIKTALGEQAVHFNSHILGNRRIIERNAKRFRLGAIFGISAPIAGLFAAGVTCLFLS
jgi:hypothetical protein